MLADISADAGSPAPRVVPRLPPTWPAGLGLAVVVSIVCRQVGLIGAEVVAVVAVTAGHGMLLVTALAASGAPWHIPAAMVLLVLAAAAALAHGFSAGALAYAAVPLLLFSLARRGPFLPGLATPVPPRAVLLGLGTGAFLGGHLLFSASRTFGYEVMVLPVGSYLTAIAYDLGANVPSAECFLRGVLFENAQRRWSFGAGLLVASVAAVARYLLDPSLPHSMEIMAGGVFYMALLSVASCALFRWSGSLVPGAVAAMVFFAAYRALSAEGTS